MRSVLVVLCLAGVGAACAARDRALDQCRIAALERVNAELEDQLRQARLSVALVEGIHCRVNAVSGDHVTLDAGDADGVVVGLVFMVPDGNFEALLQVIEVGPDTCRARVRSAKRPLRVGEPAETVRLEMTQ